MFDLIAKIVDCTFLACLILIYINCAQLSFLPIHLLLEFEKVYIFLFFLKIHIVHYNTKYPNIKDAMTQVDGLAVLGFFIEVGETIHNLLLFTWRL